MRDANTLRIALLHAAIAHGDVEKNRKRLLAMIAEAAEQGAKIITAPEMALPGYSFESREAIAPCVEPVDGPTLTAVAALARNHGVYVCIGLALETAKTAIFHNSAVVIDPAGRTVCQYNKINAESRWACPGDPRQNNTFDTPWGRVGVLICSDSYFGLMPRTTALRGVELLLVPANWPPSGIDPCELWRARAMENGIFLAGCNRTGVDRVMDCKKAPSCVFDPSGRTILEPTTAAGSIILQVDLPLNAEGRLDDWPRKKRMATRCPEKYHDCYRNLRAVQDLTSLLNLPAAAVMAANAVVPEEKEHPVEALARTLGQQSPAVGLFLLPWFDYSDEDLRRIGEMAGSRQVEVVTCRRAGDVCTGLVFSMDGLMQSLPLALTACQQAPGDGLADTASARLKLAPFDFLAHPEPAVAAAKRGCDLVVAFGDTLNESQHLLSGVRTIDYLSVACVTPAGAGIWLPPEGHQRWEERIAAPGEVCTLSVDTNRTRQKRFQDSIDFDTLLK